MKTFLEYFITEATKKNAAAIITSRLQPTSSWQDAMQAISDTGFDPDHKDHMRLALHHPDLGVAHKAFNHEDMSADHLSHALTSPHIEIATSAFNSPLYSKPTHVEAALRSPHARIAGAAIYQSPQNRLFNVKKHGEVVLQHPDDGLISHILQNGFPGGGNVSGGQLMKLFSSGTAQRKLHLIKSGHIDVKKNMKTILGDEHASVMQTGIDSPDFDPSEHLVHIFDSSSPHAEKLSTQLLAGVSHFTRKNPIHPKISNRDIIAATVKSPKLMDRYNVSDVIYHPDYDKKHDVDMIRHISNESAASRIIRRNPGNKQVISNALQNRHRGPGVAAIDVIHPLDFPKTLVKTALSGPAADHFVMSRHFDVQSHAGYLLNRKINRGDKGTPLALDHMMRYQWNKIDDTMWGRLLNHDHEGVRRSALELAPNHLKQPKVEPVEPRASRPSLLGRYFGGMLGRKNP